MAAKPAISFTVIVPVLNGEKFIDRAIKSIYNQSYPSIEILVFDGGSKDQTLQILETYPELITVSCPDKGPHDVMNLGIEAARGEIITFLNCDDFFVNDIFVKVNEVFKGNPSLEIVGGGSAVITEPIQGEPTILAERTHKTDAGLAMEELMLGAPCFNSRFFRKSLFDRIGNFNLCYEYAADRDLLLRAATTGTASKTLDSLFYIFESHPDSRTLDKKLSNQQHISNEHKRIAENIILTAGKRNTSSNIARAWLGFETLRQIVWQLKRGEFFISIKAFHQASRNDCRWLFFGFYGWLIAKRLWRRDRSGKRYRRTLIRAISNI